MITIKIRRDKINDGTRWWIENWDTYIEYLEANDLPKPVHRYAVFIGDDLRLDYPSLEKEIPAMFYLKMDKVKIEHL